MAKNSFLYAEKSLQNANVKIHIAIHGYLTTTYMYNTHLGRLSETKFRRNTSMIG